MVLTLVSSTSRANFKTFVHLSASPMSTNNQEKDLYFLCQIYMVRSLKNYNHLITSAFTHSVFIQRTIIDSYYLSLDCKFLEALKYFLNERIKKNI